MTRGTSMAIHGIFSGHECIPDTIKTLNMPLKGMDIKLTILENRLVNP